MPETRHRTVIEVGVDDREIRGLDRTMRSAFDERVIASFERSMERSTRTMERMLRVVTKLEEALQSLPAAAGGGGGGGPAGAGGGPGGPPAGGGGGGGGGGQPDLRALARSIDRLAGATSQNRPTGFGGRVGATALGTYLGNVGQGAVGGRFLQAAVSGIPVFGPMVAGAMGQVQQLYSEYAGQQQAMAPLLGTLGQIPGAGQSFRRYGLDRAQAAAQMGQFVQAAGMEAGAMPKDLIQMAQQAQFYGGVQGGGLDLIRAYQTGRGYRAPGVGIAGAAGAVDVGPVTVGQGRKARGGMAGITPAIMGYGLLAGIRPAQMGQFTGGIAQMVEQNRLMGGAMELQAPAQLISALAQLQGGGGGGITGFQGRAGMQAGQQIMGRMQNFEPGQMDLGSMLMLQAAGYPEVGYRVAMRRIQGAEGAEAQMEVFRNVQQQIQEMGGGAGTEGATYLMHRLMPQMFGVGGQMTQAEALAGGAIGQGREAEAEEIGRQWIAQREERVQAGFRVPAAEAAYRQARVGVGGQVSGAARAARTFELNITRTTLVPLAQASRRLVEWVNEAFAALTREGGGPEAAAEIMLRGPRPVGGGRGGEERAEQTLGEKVQNVLTRAAAGAAMPPAVQVPLEIGRTIRNLTGAPPPAEVERQTQGGGAAPVSEMGPQSSAADALRRAQHYMGLAADAIERGGDFDEGELALG